MGASGVDVHVKLDQPLYIFPHQTVLVPTGLHVAIPSGYELQVRPRSGFATRYGVMFPNSPGTIDSDYRGEIRIPVRNIADSVCVIRPQDRIAQLICARSRRIRWRRTPPSSHLSVSQRGSGGFGSTGR